MTEKTAKTPKTKAKSKVEASVDEAHVASEQDVLDAMKVANDDVVAAVQGMSVK